MAPVYGKDGFSDCTRLCNPSYGYGPSCKIQCEGIYNFTTTESQVHSSIKTTPNVSEASSQVTPKSLASKEDTSTYLTNDITNLPNSNFVQLSVNWIPFLIVGILVFITILLLVYFRKQRMRHRKGRKHPESIKQPDATMEITGNKIPESESLLENINMNQSKSDNYLTNEDKDSTSVYEEDRSNINTAKERGFVAYNSAEMDSKEAGYNSSNTDTAPVHYDDVGFQAINRDRYDESDTDTSVDDNQTTNNTTDTDTSVDDNQTTGNTIVSAQFTNENTLDGKLTTLTEDSLTGRVEEKGIIRVITEIKLR